MKTTIINEVKNVEWVKADWAKLRGTCIAYVGTADVDRLVENTFRRIAKDLHVPYKDILPILREENAEFYRRKEEMYKVADGYRKNNPALLELEALLKVPDMALLLQSREFEALKKQFNC